MNRIIGGKIYDIDSLRPIAKRKGLLPGACVFLHKLNGEFFTDSVIIGEGKHDFCETFMHLEKNHDWQPFNGDWDNPEFLAIFPRAERLE